MKAQTGTEMIVLLSVGIFIVVTFALLFVDFTGGIDTQEKEFHDAQLKKYPVGIKTYLLSENCTYVELVNNQATDIVIEDVIVDSLSFNTSLFPSTLVPRQSKSYMGCAYNNTYGEVYDLDVQINYSILNRNRIQTDDDFSLKGVVIDDSSLTTAQSSLLPVGFSIVELSDSCSSFRLINNRIDSVNITSISINGIVIQTNKQIPFLMNPSHSQSLLTCNITPSANTQVSYPIIVNYTINDVSQTQNFSTFFEGTSVNRLPSFEPNEFIYSDSLFGFWKLENNTRDSAGLHVQGTLNGNPQLVSGISGFAYEFDGVGDFVDTLVLDSMSDGDFTVSAWVNSTTPSLYAVVQQHLAGGYSSDWIVAGNSFALWMRAQTVGTASYFDGDWHHLALVFNSSLNRYEGYLDGVSLGVSADVGSHGGIASVKIGARGDGVSTFYTGIVDEVALWNRTLSDVEIKSLYLRGSNSLS